MLGGLSIADVEVGKGTAARTGDTVRVHYTGHLADGSVFDSSAGKAPFEFKLGQGQVIRGWDMGVSGMKPGGKRKLIIPPGLAYGSKSMGNGRIPPNSTLYFEVELLEVR
jgi:FKBP-type peptidyl-prolyl cis-trans isomerase